MNYHYFINRDYDPKSLIKLPFNKSKLTVKYKGKWIKGSEIYNLGYQDPNMSGKCTECDKPINNYKWDCDQCHIKRQKANNELMQEFNTIFKGVFK